MSLSSMLEAELDDYFQDRNHKSPNVADKSKSKASKERDPDDPEDNSSCCYSGCPSCPWGYQA